MFYISRFKRYEKNGVHGGGVEKHAFYLQQAIPEMTLISWEDYPNRFDEGERTDYEKADILNRWLLSDKIVGPSDIVIVDGYWGLGLQGKVGRLISVCHGSYFGRYVQSLIYPWGERVDPYEMDAQDEMWSNCEVVAVSASSAYELYCLGHDSTTIRHGIFLDVYKPLGKERRCYMHAATSTRKGADLIELMSDQVSIEFMNEYSCKMDREAARLNDAMVLFAPTRHEGNAYLLIEALACGTPVLTYATGFATEFGPECGVITDDLSGDNLLNLLTQTDWSSFSPREWAEKRISFEEFKTRWRAYLECK